MRHSGHDVPHVELHARGLHALGDAFELLLVFGIDVRPELLAAGLAVKVPVSLGVVGAFELGTLTMSTISAESRRPC